MVFRTVSQMFNQVTNDHLSRKLYFYKKASNWQGISGSEIRSTVKDLSFGIQSIGIEKGNNVALLSNNNPRWAMSDYGIVCSGAATVSVYPTLIPSQVEYILNNSCSKVVFVEGQEQLAKIVEVWGNCSQLNYAIVMDNSNTESNDKIFNFMEFLDIGTKHEQKTKSSLVELISNHEPKDLLFF